MRHLQSENVQTSIFPMDNDKNNNKKAIENARCAVTIMDHHHKHQTCFVRINIADLK